MSDNPQRTQKPSGFDGVNWCGHCANQGKSVFICSSHRVNNCRLMANTRCLSCNHLGHTASRCSRAAAGGGPRSTAESASDSKTSSFSKASSFRGCGHCRNMGKPENIYMSHLANQCRAMKCVRCGGNGHTESRCTQPENEEQVEVDPEAEAAAEAEAEVETDSQREIMTVLSEEDELRMNLEQAIDYIADLEEHNANLENLVVEADTTAEQLEVLHTNLDDVMEHASIVERRNTDLEARIALLESEIASLRDLRDLHKETK